MKTTGQYKIFSFRKNYLDSILLTIMPSTFLIYTSAPSIIILFFVFFGLWLTFQKPFLLKDNRAIFIISALIPVYLLFNVSWIGFSTGKWNGLNSVFPLYFVLTIPTIIGLALVPNPMKALVLGCRIATILLALYSTYSLIEFSWMRIGFGTNALIAAYVVMIFACVSRFQLKGTEQPWVGRVYFYVGFISAVATASRSVILFYFAALILEVIFSIYKFCKKDKAAIRNLILVLVLSCIVVLLCIKYDQILRISSGLNALTSGDILLDESVKLRFYMWEFGWSAFTQNFLFGIGAANILDEIGAYMKQVHNISFAARHLHNVLIQELAAHGIIGASLIFIYHYLIYNTANGHFKSLPEKHSLYLLFLGILIYGLTGSHLTDDRTILITIFVFATLIKTAKKMPESNNSIN